MDSIMPTLTESPRNNQSLELRGANATYNGKAVLHDITLSIAPGERVALVGESGAGKSTLLRLLYQRFPEGAALVPQDFGLVHNLSVFHNVYMGRLHRNTTWYNLLNLIKPLHKEVEQVSQILERFNLSEKLFVPAGELSGGQQQRTAVARALYQQGQLLLGDEPVSALDERQSRLVLDAINDTYDTVILAMHDVRLALEYTDRVVGIRQGVLRLDEPTSNLALSDLQQLYTP